MINLITSVPYNDPDVFDIRVDEVIYHNLKMSHSQPFLINRDSKVLTLDQSSTISVETFFDFYAKVFSAFDFQKPFMIVVPEGRFTHLNNFKYSLETTQHLNEHGLHIFLYEIPLLMYYNDIDYTGDHIHLRSMHIDSDYASVKPSIVGSQDRAISCLDFDTIERFVRNNNLTNVQVYTGFYNIDKYFKKYSFDIHTYDLILNTCSQMHNSNTILTYNKDEKFPKSSKIKYKFISTAKKYLGYRELVTAFLYNKNSLLSYIHKSSDFDVFIDGEEVESNQWDYFWEDIDRRLPFNFSTWKTAHPKKYKKITENLKYIHKNLYIDQKDNCKFDGIHDIDLIDILLPYDDIKQSFVYVVLESVYAQPFGYVSEKTLTAIKTFRPFLLFSPPYSLEYLQSIGYKTFSNFWDESYDKETNHERRFIKILDVIEKINKMSIDECQSMYKEMEPILTHNFQNIVNRLPK